jgi:hypothetical protein
LEGALICFYKTFLDVRFGTSLAWAPIGVGIPQVGFDDPHPRNNHTMDVSFGGMRKHLEGRHISLI